MTVHMSARLAWHMDGWNGHVCKDPASNTYCVGPHSYPGEMIAEKRDLKLEANPDHAGKCCTKLNFIPPCVYSINAFGAKQIKAYADPPSWWKDGTSRHEWKLPAASMCIWPYEEMYRDEVKKGGKYDYDERLKFAEEYFDQLEEGESLIFYYSNYSNPLNQADERRYVIVGMSRIKQIADIRKFPDSSERVRERYAGGFIWQCDITSEYPDQGFRLPYHLYLKEPEVLDQFAYFPDKYATRAISDDDALEIVPGLVEKVVTPSPGGYIPGVVIPLTEGVHHHVTKVSEVIPSWQVIKRPWQAASQGSPD